jgi:hypothetical protein
VIRTPARSSGRSRVLPEVTSLARTVPGTIRRVATSRMLTR